MSSDKDLARDLQVWLHEDAHEYGDRVLDSVVELLDSTPQRPASWLARSLQNVTSNPVRLGLAAAAVVILAIIGVRLIGGSNIGGPGPLPTGAPSEAAEGPFTLWDAPGDVGIAVTIPGPGWFGDEGRGVLLNRNVDPSGGAGVMVFQGPLYVYGDACHWSTTTPDAPATTAEDMRAALDAQTSHSGGARGEFWSIGGSLGGAVDLYVPHDAVLSDCDEGQIRYWVGDPALDTNARYHESPGQVDQLWLGTVNGVPVVFDVFFPGPPRNVVDELWVAIDHEATTFGVGQSSQPSATGEPSAAEPSVPPTPEPQWQDSALSCCAQGDIMPLPAGPFVAWDDVHGGWNVTVTIPGSGWSGAESHAIIYGNNLGDSLDPPDGAGLLVFQVGDVPPDPCAWLADPSVDTLGTVDGYVAAFAGQVSRDASEPIDIAVAGHSGKVITLHVPDDAVFSECEQGALVTLMGRSFGDPVPWPDRYAQGPGQIDEFWIVDVGGHVVMFDITYGPQTAPDVIDQLRTMVESTAFGTTFQ